MQEEHDYSKYLLPSEIFWRDHFKWLHQCGFELRPRYRPDWRPSWLGSDDLTERYGAEDHWRANHWSTIDATRLSDGKRVTLKKIEQSDHPQEAELALFLSSSKLASDPRNHCVPIYEVLSRQEENDFKILVMPRLRELKSPKFDTCGELVECFRQLIEGLQFMHTLNVAHGDCGDQNIMMDAMQLYPRGYHPGMLRFEPDGKKSAKPLTRTQKPTKYFYVDFGLSYRFESYEARKKLVPIPGGDKSVPEFKDGGDRIPQDPFATDIYYLGHVMQRMLEGDRFYPGYKGLKFMDELITDMTNVDPLKRPTMDEVAARFDKILQSLSSWKLRSRAKRRDEIFLQTPFRAIPYWIRRINFIFTRTPALPRYSS